ncbi:MAG: plasmid stabilization protein [Candidatus Riflebacteria bacterium]|jgi:plasmid stability protein|nr:plasmid stabilization protein [Candidatus Riflebacteria bacterium]
MASITIRNIDEELKSLLRLSAASRNVSMEEEARQILRRFLLRKKSSEGIGSRIASRYAQIGGIDLPPVIRSMPRSGELEPEDGQS